MADDTLVVDIIVGKNDLQKHLNSLANINKLPFFGTPGTGKTQFGRMADDIGKIDLSTLENVMNELRRSGRLTAEGFGDFVMTDQIREFGESVGLTKKQMDRFFREGQAQANKFDARLLSILFTGMALSRTFGGALRGITNTFIKAEDNTSELGKATTRLGAAWEFFKFSLFDALNQPFFINIIDGIVNVLNWFSQLPDGVRTTITSVIGILGGIGTGALIYSQIKLAWGAVFGVGGILAKQATQTGTAVTGIKTAVTTLKTATATLSFTGLLTALGAVGAAAITAWWFIDRMNAWADSQLAPEISLTDMGIDPDSVTNLDKVRSGVEKNVQEFSNLNGGMDRTVELLQTFNPLTGETNSTIQTMQEKTKNLHVEQNTLNEIMAPLIEKIDLSKIALEEETLALDENTDAIIRNREARSEGTSFPEGVSFLRNASSITTP